MDRQDLLNLFDSTTAHCRAVMVKKNTDYCAGEAGADADPFANFRISEAVGVHPVLGLLMRMMDKMQRVRAFVNDGKLAVSDETVEDAFDDMVNYAILGKGLMKSIRDEARAVGVPVTGWKPGDIVNWKDPDDALCSHAGVLQSVKLKGDVIQIVMEDGWQADVFAHELHRLT